MIMGYIVGEVTMDTSWSVLTKKLLQLEIAAQP